MQAPKYVERNIDQRRYREMCRVNHFSKLNDLKAIKDVKGVTKIQEDQYRKINKIRSQVQCFEQAEKNMGINRENQILLNKLVEISAGKWSSVVPAPKRIRQMAKQSSSMARNFSISNLGQHVGAPGSKSGSVGPRSLNINNRKEQNMRIERENQKFAKKLYESKGSIIKKKFDREYQHQTQYRMNIQKVKAGSFSGALPPTFSTRNQRLPPLGYRQSQENSAERAQTQIESERHEYDSQQLNDVQERLEMDIQPAQRPEAAQETNKPSTRPKMVNKPAENHDIAESQGEHEVVEQTAENDGQEVTVPTPKDEHKPTEIKEQKADDLADQEQE